MEKNDAIRGRRLTKITNDDKDYRTHEPTSISSGMVVVTSMMFSRWEKKGVFTMYHMSWSALSRVGTLTSGTLMNTFMSSLEGANLWVKYWEKLLSNFQGRSSQIYIV